MDTEQAMNNDNDWFWAKVRRTDADGCWEWLAAIQSTGYGGFTITRQFVRTEWQAHRYAFTITHGPIPSGQCVLHRCDNRKCVNPAHLFLGSKSDNSRDMVAKGRNRGCTRRVQFKDGRCSRGHDITAPGAMMERPCADGRVHRECRQCRRDNALVKTFREAKR